MAQQRLRGARPSPRHVLLAAMPHFAVGPTPAAFLWLPSSLSYWLNNTFGCCVSTEEAFRCACTGVKIADQTVGQWAQQHGVLNGAVISDVLTWMQQRGFSQDGNYYNTGGHAAVDYTNAAVLQNAISQGPVKIGVAADQLQNAVGQSNGWFATGFRPDGNLDHCVSLCGYGTMGWLAQQLGVQVPANLNPQALGYALFTWDTIGIIDPQSMVNITGEAWLRSPNTITVGSSPPTPDPVTTPSLPPPGPAPTPTPTPTPTPVPPGPQPPFPWPPSPNPNPGPGPQPRPHPALCAVIAAEIKQLQASGNVFAAMMLQQMAVRMGCTSMAPERALSFPSFNTIIQEIVDAAGSVEAALPKIVEVLKILQGLTG